MFADIWQLHGEQLSLNRQDTLILLVEPNIIKYEIVTKIHLTPRFQKNENIKKDINTTQFYEQVDSNIEHNLECESSTRAFYSSHDRKINKNIYQKLIIFILSS